jgi:hypothetical protein
MRLLSVGRSDIASEIDLRSFSTESVIFDRINGFCLPVNVCVAAKADLALSNNRKR